LDIRKGKGIFLQKKRYNRVYKGNG